MARSQAERDRIAAWWHLRRMERQLQGIQAQIAALSCGRDTAADDPRIPPHAPSAAQREELAHWQRHLADLRREMAAVHQRAYPHLYRDENERTA